MFPQSYLWIGPTQCITFRRMRFCRCVSKRKLCLLFVLLSIRPSRSVSAMLIRYFDVRHSLCGSTSAATVFFLHNVSLAIQIRFFEFPQSPSHRKPLFSFLTYPSRITLAIIFDLSKSGHRYEAARSAACRFLCIGTPHG